VTNETPVSAREVVKRTLRLPLVHRFVLVWRLARSPRVPLRARLPLLAMLIYLALPIDLIPDFIPVVGQLDDLLVAAVAVGWFARHCPPAVALDEIARLEATPLGPFGRRVPWLLGGATVLIGVVVVVWLIHKAW